MVLRFFFLIIEVCIATMTMPTTETITGSGSNVGALYLSV